MKTILKTSRLSKSYGTIKALDGLDVTIEQGMVFGILGPNGSGKTTTLGILLGITIPNSGSFEWFGNSNACENRKRIGALLETPNFYPYLNALQNLEIVSTIKDLSDSFNVQSRIEEVLNLVDLYDRRTSSFKSYSLGMKQRLAIASALLNDPEVLVLDEPTNGLDPQGIAEIRTIIQAIAKQGKTIIIASHALDEVEKVCTDVLILKKGVAIKQSKIESVSQIARQIVLKCTDLVKAEALAKQIEFVDKVEFFEDALLLTVKDHVNAASINQYYFDKGIVLSELKEVKKSLETQFLEITKT